MVGYLQMQNTMFFAIASIHVTLPVHVVFNTIPVTENAAL
jgi:hypothetical protein